MHSGALRVWLPDDEAPRTTTASPRSGSPASGSNGIDAAGSIISRRHSAT